MADSSEYTPPKIWVENKPSGGRFANINRPIGGPTHEKELPVGRHPLQLYSLGTPNGVKVTILLEELLALGNSGADYDAWLIKIGDGNQFGSGFVAVNPNSKIPALLDRSGANADPRLRIRFDPAVLRREIRCVPADGIRAARGVSVVAVLANGEHALMTPLIFDSNVHRENLDEAGDDSFIVTTLAGPRKAGGRASGNPNHDTGVSRFGASLTY